jgi:hypothetical protein
MTSIVRRVSQRPLLVAALALATLFHGTLLAMGSFRRTYDAYVHIFFADHYARGWFTTWEPRWYTGFTVTSYPPGTHQLTALLARLIGLEAGFAVVQLAGILLVVVGVYRLASLLTSRRAAGYAAIISVLSTGIAEAVHVFGQLPTICSLGLLLNSLPHVRRWIVEGHRGHLVTAAALLAGTTALHHVTTLFGAVFFLGPVIAHGLLERFRTPLAGESAARPHRVTRDTIGPLVARRLRRIVRPLGRAALLAVLVVAVLLVVVLPYWIWSRTDPIVQIPIPHGSRENFLEDVNAGLLFWLIPWGMMLMVLPYAIVRGLRSSAWPFIASLGLLAMLGTGGTTPLPRMLLGGAFDILTLDRFTFWATIVVLPFAGMMAESLLHGGLRRRLSVVVGSWAPRVTQVILVILLLGSAIFTVTLTQYRRLQPDPVDPAPIVAFLERDQHWQWRYLTLGLGDQMAWLSAQTIAQSVDGNYHSARRLPELITTPVERLEGAKFRGVRGLGSLQQFLAVPEKYHLKFVFSADQFYDPLLYFSGWRPLSRLENDVVVWEREDVAPMPAVVETRELPLAHRLMWGVFPMSALAAALTAAGLSASGALGRAGRGSSRRSGRSAVDRFEGWLERHAEMSNGGATRASSWKQPLQGFVEAVRPSDSVLRTVLCCLVAGVVAGGGFLILAGEEPGPEATVIAYYDDLDFHRFEAAWDRLDPMSRPSLSDYLVGLSVKDGLLDSYASLNDVAVKAIARTDEGAIVEVSASYVTALAEYHIDETVTLRKSADGWVITPDQEVAHEPVERLARRSGVDFLPLGRRAVTTDTTEYDDVLDRPELELSHSRVVLFDGNPTVVGWIRNVDADPGALTITAQLLETDGAPTATYNSGRVVQHSLLPGEGTSFRVDFEGVAGDDVGSFDPHDFEALDIAEPSGLDVYAKATVTGRGLDRPIVLQGIVVSVADDGVAQLSGSVLNLGLDDATVVALLVSLYDEDGALIWVDWILISDAIRPGLEAEFAAPLTARHRLQPLSLATTQHFVNGLPRLELVATDQGLIPVPDGAGYSALAVQPVTYQRGITP